MSVAYFDTSALLKRYVTETGSSWVSAYLTASAGLEVFTSSLTTVEATCAFSRRLREGILTPAMYTVVESAFDHDIKYKYNILDVNPMTLETARQFAKRHVLRAYDAVQLATAWLANQRLIQTQKPPLTFICADERLLSIAKAEGLPSENPSRYS